MNKYLNVVVSLRASSIMYTLSTYPAQSVWERERSIYRTIPNTSHEQNLNKLHFISHNFSFSLAFPPYFICIEIGRKVKLSKEKKNRKLFLWASH